jgi:MFS family permease
MSKNIFRGWYVVAACFLCMVISGGIAWFTFPVFVVPLQEEFGWTATQLGIAIALWAAVGGAFAPILGRLLDRFGARRIMLIGVFLGGLLPFGLAEMQSLRHLYPLLILSALCTSASTYLPVASVISKWFVKKSGMAMGIAMMGMGVGGTIAPIITNYLIQTTSWRWTYRVFGLSLWIFLIPVVALWIHGSPSDLGLKPDGIDSDEADAETSPNASDEDSADGFTAPQAFRLRSFWGLGLADAVTAIPIVAIGVFMVKFSVEAGIDADVATFALGSVSAVGILGSVVAGAMADKVNRKIVLSINYAFPAIAVLFLFGLKSAGPLFFFAILSGLTVGFRSTLWPLVVGDCFGSRAYATVMGFLIIFYQAGTIIGPPLAGYIRDTTESFHGVFVLSVAAYAVSGIFVAAGTMGTTGKAQENSSQI